MTDYTELLALLDAMGSRLAKNSSAAIRDLQAQLAAERKAREEAERVSELRKQEWGKCSSTCAQLQTRAEAAEAKCSRLQLELDLLNGEPT